jgi:hypothetical protein
MSRRAIVLLAASVIAGLASTAAVSTDAFAKKATRHPVAVVAAPPPAPVAVAVIDNNYGPIADRIPRCFDSAVWYPRPPCY